MIVVEKNIGPKIEYEVTGNWLAFRDELALNLASKERDDDVEIDVFETRIGDLQTGISDYYVAQVMIPARRYTEEDGGVDENEQPIINREPLPFDVDLCTLVLWALESPGPEQEGETVNG